MILQNSENKVNFSYELLKFKVPLCYFSSYRLLVVEIIEKLFKFFLLKTEPSLII
jgi:hypothetical protein